MDGAALRTERVGSTEVLTLADGARLNPLTAGVQHALLGALEWVREDRTVRALLLTGEGRGFCVGADLSSITGGEPGGHSVGQRTARLMTESSNPIVLGLRELPVPVVVAVNGACAGAGVGLALAGDVLLLAHSAYFYLPFAPRLGLIPDLGASWFLERSLGRSRALAMTLLDERLPAQQAVDWGLAWACVEDETLRGQALAIADKLGQLPAHAVLEARRAYDHAAASALPQQLAYEAGRQRELLDLPSFDEGVQAFLNKRAPRFSGR